MRRFWIATFLLISTAILPMTAGVGLARHSTESPLYWMIITISNWDRTRPCDLYRLLPGTGKLENLTQDSRIVEYFDGWSPDGEWIYLTASDNYPNNIYRIRPDGSDRHRLTWDDARYHFQSWSPDGEWFIYTSQQRSSTKIMRVRPDGTDSAIIFEGGDAILDVIWSLDSQWILFITSTGYSWQIYRIRIDGSGLQLVASFEDIPQLVAWSPDGEWMLLNVWGQVAQFYWMRPNGDDLSQSPALDSGRAVGWSPDGEWILFSSGATRYDYSLYRIRPDGTDMENLAPILEGLQGMFPYYNQGGNWIIFRAKRDGNYGLYRMQVDGSDVQQLTDSPTSETFLTWSPDGRWIIYEGYTDSGLDLFRIRSDGSQQERLTDTWLVEYFEGWSPPIDHPWHGWRLIGLASIILAGVMINSLRRTSN